MCSHQNKQLRRWSWGQSAHTPAEQWSWSIEHSISFLRLPVLFGRSLYLQIWNAHREHTDIPLIHQRRDRIHHITFHLLHLQLRKTLFSGCPKKPMLSVFILYRHSHVFKHYILFNRPFPLLFDEGLIASLTIHPKTFVLCTKVYFPMKHLYSESLGKETVVVLRTCS